MAILKIQQKFASLVVLARYKYSRVICITESPVALWVCMGLKGAGLVRARVFAFVVSNLGMFRGRLVTSSKGVGPPSRSGGLQ